MRLMTFAGARSGRSICSPACFFQQLLERIFVVVLKFFRIEVPGFGLDDVRGQLQHVLWNFFIREYPRNIRPLCGPHTDIAA